MGASVNAIDDDVRAIGKLVNEAFGRDPPDNRFCRPGCIEDRELAMLAFACRVGEGLIAALPLTTLGLLWLATNAGPTAPDVPSANAFATFLLRVGTWETISASLLFSAGSTLFSYLLLRGRMIPVALAWLGVSGSALLVVSLPLQLAGFLTGSITQLVWIPVGLFELTLAPWLLIKGVGPARNQSV